jgi:hypothetical protein
MASFHSTSSSFALLLQETSDLGLATTFRVFFPLISRNATDLLRAPHSTGLWCTRIRQYRGIQAQKVPWSRIHLSPSCLRQTLAKFWSSWRGGQTTTTFSFAT